MSISRIPAGVASGAFPAADGTRPGEPGPDGAESRRTPSDGVSATTPAADPLRLALLVSRARTAARSGDLDGALRLLHEADDPAVAAHPDVLDLLARLHAQRGELAQAAEYWRRVRQRHPRDPAAAAGLARIDRLGRRWPRAALTRHRAGTALAAAVCAVAAITVGTVALTDGADGPAGEPGPSQADRAERLAERLDAERRADQARERTQETARRAEAATALADALRAPGISPVVREGSVEVAFADGLFSEGAELTPVGAERLAVLGERLAGRKARIEIYGQTATVPGAPRSGGSVLSLWRALIAARELSAAAGRPLTDFTTASADQRDAPFAGAARNRTVTVVITPA
ncbi:tetratricopeptide repeat protein [Streptomyces sp. NPDC056479]|uniref:tetratricopeptide repeat protein n=1 Tax=Streptomyces sp. NPDC056479 TaxID=3345832 RepID=UPI0036927F50